MSDGSQESTSHWAQGELYLDCVVMHDPLFVLCQMEVLGTGEMYLDCVVHDLLFVLCQVEESGEHVTLGTSCLLYTSPSPRDSLRSRMPSSA